ncbi:glycosyltransferase family 39 protein [Burkholderia sp. PU8-34]
MTQSLTHEPPHALDETREAGNTWLLIALLPAHAIVWTIAAWLSRGNLDMQGDMIENYAWGIEWQAGYAKHPPLFAWITAAWFKFFPNTEIAYFALSSLNAMVGLLGIVALAGRDLPRRLAVVAGLAMAVSPLYSNLAVKFNANAVLLSIWPWTAYCFVRFMQTGGWRSALALGALAGASLLGKYFSVVLLMALFAAALVRPAWRMRLFSWKTLLAAIAGAIVLAPHVVWLVDNAFLTFDYAQDRTGGTLPAALERFGIYTAAQLGYLALSFLFVIVLVRRARWQAAKVMAASYVRPGLCPDLWCLALGPLIATGVVAVLTKTQMASVWGMAAWFAIVPLWLKVLHAHRFEIVAERAGRILAGYWVVVIVVTAAVGYIGVLRQSDDAAEPRAELAEAANAMWRVRTGQDVPVVAGSVHEAQSIAFYGSGYTRYWDMIDPRMTPWLTAADARKLGAMFVCRLGDTVCLDASAALSGVEPTIVEVRKQAWGRVLVPRRYALFMSVAQQ